MPPPGQEEQPRISLIPGFGVISESQPQDFGTSSSKLLAYLALQREPLERTAVAAALWPHVRDARAAANLRTALWRVSQLDPDLVEVGGNRIGLNPDVEIDYRQYEDLARQVLRRESLETLIETSEGPQLGIEHTIHRLTGELLTHWYDEWLIVHQERWRQLRLHALDSLSLQLTEAGWCASAVDAATAAVAAEPLRESGYRSLMVAHLAEGNVSEAVRTHERYCTLLERELGIAPSLQMYELVSQATGTASARTVNGADRPRSGAAGRRPMENVRAISASRRG
jgi:DNA-binding SARP family transcriptional activator